ncbi:MAG: ChrR family anti-sigma-E factor [Pseudomonadota bacterium]
MTTQAELLTAYAAGTTSPGLALLCSAHLTLSPESRRFVAGLEEVNGVLLRETEASEPMASNGFDALMARIDADGDAAAERPSARPSAAARTSGEAGPLTRPVADAVGVDFADIPWKRKLAGISEHKLPCYAPESVSLLKAPPGARVPHHTHTGGEATLILAGEMRDGARRLTVGDIALNGPDDNHHPEITGDDVCYCLIVADGALRFKGALGAALNLLQR